MKNSIIQILKDVKLSNKKNKSILLSPASASYDQFLNFEKRGMNLKKLKIFMLENSYKLQLIHSWRNMTKKFFFAL